MGIKLTGGKNWHLIGKEICECCHRNEALHTVEDPDLGRDFSGNFYTVKICHGCYDNYRQLIDDELIDDGIPLPGEDW